jgi:hypothetical protein
MRTGIVEELNIVTHDTSQVRLVDDQQLVQALFSHRTNPPLSMRIGIRRTIRRGDHVNAFRTKNSIKGLAELLVVVADQKSDVGVAGLQRPQHLPGLLGAPGIVRMGGAACEMHAPAAPPTVRLPGQSAVAPLDCVVDRST